MPSVSVIIPTFNRAISIRRSIDSVLSQSFSDFELIVVDDCSEDDTEQVVRSYSDPRIKYLKSERNQGASAARNIGIEISQGHYVAFQDSDDVWFPDKLKRCMESFSENSDEVGVVFSSYLKRQDGLLYLVPEVAPCNVIRSGDPRIVGGNFIGTPTAVVRRDLLTRVGGFDISMPRYQDWELFIRLSKTCDFFFIDEPLVLAFFSKDGISSNSGSHYCALTTIYNKNISDIEKSSALRVTWMLKFADAYIRSGKKSASVDCIFTVFKLGKCNLRALVILCFALVSSGAFYSNCMSLASNIKARLRQKRLRKYLGLIPASL